MQVVHGKIVEIQEVVEERMASLASACDAMEAARQVHPYPPRFCRVCRALHAHGAWPATASSQHCSRLPIVGPIRPPRGPETKKYMS